MLTIAEDNSECLEIDMCALWNNVLCGGDGELGPWGKCDLVL